MIATNHFKNIIELHTKKKKYSTLGGRSYFFLIGKNNELIFQNSQNKQYRVNEHLFSEVFTRYNNANPKDKHMTSYYTFNKWISCPGKIVCPYVASVIKINL
jgi:hypothetical protein